MSRPGRYLLEIRSRGLLIRTERFYLFSNLLKAVRKQPLSRHLYAYDEDAHDYDTNGLSEEQNELFLEAANSRTRSPRGSRS